MLFLLLVIASVSINAQTHTVTGKVIDERGQVFSGASIIVKGTQFATTSDINGDFILEVPDGRNVFMIQALGYNQRLIEDTSEFLIVNLVAVSKNMETNVTTPFYTVRDKRELGYTSSTISSEDYNDGNNTNAISALTGKIAGANISSSTGGPGGDVRIVLRGEKSFLHNNNAIIVVDGVVMNNYDRTASNQGLSNVLSQVDFGNSINDINPEEIESITVLQGGPATALYGAQGANGAVMITTKKGNHKEAGKDRKFEITYKTTYTQSNVLKVPDFQHQYGQGNIYTSTNHDGRPDNTSWGNPFDGALRPWGQIILGKELVKPYTDLADNIRRFYDRGKALDNFVSLSGSTETSTYYIALNTLNNLGIVPNDFYNKYSIRFNGCKQLSNNFYSIINFNYINTYSRTEYQGQGGPTGNGGVMENLLNIPRDIPVWELSNLSNKFYSMQYYDAAGVNRFGYFGGSSVNPYWSAKYFDNRNRTDNLLGDITLGYHKSELNIYDRLGANINADKSTYNTPQYSMIAQDITGLYPGKSYTSNGGFAMYNSNAIRLSNDLIANYTHKLGENFAYNATIGSNTTLQQTTSMNGNIDPVSNGLVITSFYDFSNAVHTPTISNYRIDNRSFGFFADFQVNYMKELFFEATGRKDYTSTLTDGSNTHFYPSGNIAWVFTERLKGAFVDKVLNYGKFRFGAAGTGNDGMPYINNNPGYQPLPIASTYGSIVTPYNSLPVYQIQNSIGNKYLKPELTREYEVGLDLSFLKDRLCAAATYYNSYSYNVVAAVPLPPSTGFLYNYTNIGEITNKGLELYLKGTPILTKWGLRWNMFGTYTKNVNNVVKLDNGQERITLGGFQGMSIIAEQGHAFGTFYANDITYVNVNGVKKILVDATTGLPVPTSVPQYKGSYLPRYQASFGTDVSWKGIKLNVLFTTKQGGLFYSNNKVLMEANGTAVETAENSRNLSVWANSVNKVGSTNNYQTNITKYLPYDYYTNIIGKNLLPAQGLVDASYIRLQEISLSYKIPKQLYERTAFGSLEAGMFGNNLFLWTAASNKYDDPEAASVGALSNGQGLNYSSRPSMKNYGVFLKVTF